MLPALSLALALAAPLLPANETAPGTVTLSMKEEADKASEVADAAVRALEFARDEAWRDSRGNLAIASSPPIRSEAVLDLLTSETQRFEKLEGQIRDAKEFARHKRRLAVRAPSACPHFARARLA